MKYLPFENFDFHTELSPDEISRRLYDAVDTERKWLIFSNKKFMGDIDKHYFRIWRLTWWNHNFTPVISGTIQADGSGSFLQIRMRMPWLGFLFYALMFGMMWFSFFMGHANLIVRRIQSGIWQFETLGEWVLAVVLHIVMLTFLYLISVGTFKWEAYRVISYLLRLVRAKKDNIVYHDQIFGINEYQIVQALFLIPLVISLGWMIFKLLQ